MSALQDYLRSLKEARHVGVKETSGYGALKALLDHAGERMKPPVRCILHPSSMGAGIPDGGLFTREQLKPLGPHADPNSVLKLNPARGAIEVKGTADNLDQLIASDQVRRYLDQYRKLLCTNYREFAVLEKHGDRVQTLERFAFAKDEAAFWADAANPARLDAEHGERFAAFLDRALLYGAPLATPESVAAFMASCAREAKLRVAEAYDAPALEQIRGSLEQALNVSFTGERAEGFFESSLVQTLFYGVFSAWILWGRENPVGTSARFDWRFSSYYLKVPAIQGLFHQLVNPHIIQTLDVVEPLNWVGDALNRVDRASFDSGFKDGSAVQYFYEPFLAAYDPELRKQLGVWYTPNEVVRYMVHRVDTVLETELGLAGGLANENVVVLDPCCGTGGYLVEVIKRIAERLQENGADALAGYDLKKAALERVFGFELLTAPFVVSHLQLGLVLQSLGAQLTGNERASVYLTNALTGWREPDGDQLKIHMPELQEEREAANEVKREKKILVIIGNPPYDGFAGVAMGEERELSNAYRTSKNPDLPKPEGHGLNELYVRFFRMAERKITEDTGQGIVCFISNYSWLEGTSHPVMREAYLRSFSKIWIDNLHGDRKISEYAPDGRTSETVFAVRGASVGIRVGTGIALLLRNENQDGRNATVLYRDHEDARASARRASLIESLASPNFDDDYKTLSPDPRLGLSFKLASTQEIYHAWPELPELFPVSFPGVKTSRDEIVVDIDFDILVERMTNYFDASLSFEDIGRMVPKAAVDTPRFAAAKTRIALVRRGISKSGFHRFYYRPFDVRWLYWEPETKLLDEKRTEYVRHVFSGNGGMVAQKISRRVSSPPQFVSSIGCIDLMDRSASIFPFLLRDESAANLFSESADIASRPNLSDLAKKYSEVIGLPAPGIFFHAFAVQHSPKYRRDNSDALRLDWPRIPLPNVQGVVQTSAAIGQRVASLLDPLTSIGGVTQNPGIEFKVWGLLSRESPKVGGAVDIGLRGGWGHRESRGAVMAGQGRSLERAWTPEELAQIDTGCSALGLDLQTALRLLGETTVDVYLNDTTYWKAVPARVWDYTLGGYRVLKKWLSYREAPILGRDLKPEEAREFTAIVRRIAALLLMEPELDANYAACAAETWRAEG